MSPSVRQWDIVRVRIRPEDRRDLPASVVNAFHRSAPLPPEKKAAFPRV